MSDEDVKPSGRIETGSLPYGEDDDAIPPTQRSPMASVQVQERAVSVTMAPSSGRAVSTTTVAHAAHDDGVVAWEDEPPTERIVHESGTAVRPEGDLEPPTELKVVA